MALIYIIAGCMSTLVYLSPLYNIITVLTHEIWLPIAINEPKLNRRTENSKKDII